MLTQAKRIFRSARPGVERKPCDVCRGCNHCMKRHSVMDHDAGRCPGCAIERSDNMTERIEVATAALEKALADFQKAAADFSKTRCMAYFEWVRITSDRLLKASDAHAQLRQEELEAIQAAGRKVPLEAIDQALERK